MDRGKQTMLTLIEIANFICQLDQVKGCVDCWQNIISVSVCDSVYRKEENLNW